MDYGWDSSDDEGGMAIDLDAQQEEHELTLRIPGNDKFVTDSGRKRISLVEDYDPAEPTDDYDPSEPTRGSDSESSNKDQHMSKNAASSNQKYDPAEPTLSDEEENSNRSFKDGNHSPATDENDGRWDSQVPLTQEDSVPSPFEDSADDDEEKSKMNSGGQSKETEQDGHERDKDNDYFSQRKNPPQANQSKRETTSLGPVDSDDNSQNCILDDIDVPDVAFDDSDFVLEKEPFDKENEQPNVAHSPWSDKDNSEKPRKDSLQGEDNASQPGEDNASQPGDDNASQQGEDNVSQDPEESESPNSEQRRLYSQEEEDRDRFRKQKEVDTRNEAALVDLFREESDADRIEEDVAQPVKKTKKKVTSKKVKKKGKKLTKDKSKKGHSKQLNDSVVEDQRFVEIRRDRQSTETREEGELEGDGGNSHRKTYGDKMSLEMYEQVFDIGNGNPDDDEQREPGEIVEEGKKRWKKRDKKEKKKKKNRREVATVEEGTQGDDDSQKFPSFLAGFFVQDEGGEEELDENLENLSRSFENDNDRTFQKGGKIYRKRHSSEAEDSVKSFDQNVSKSQEVRSQEVDHRKSRKHDERGHESRDRRQYEIRDAREVRREREHHHATPRDRDRERDRERERERERSRNERERERLRVREREKERERERERDREVVWDRDRERNRRVEMDERRGHHRVRSLSREHRRRSNTAERVRRSRSRDRSSRHRRHRSKSRERSVEREREREKERERSKRRHRERSPERESERRVRRPSHSRSRSPRHRSERAGSDKENRDENHRRRWHVRAHEESEPEDRDDGHRRHRRERREPERSSSASSSSSVSSDNGARPRNSGHHYNFNTHYTSDEDGSSDVILVEPERIVINLDEEEDPPSRVDITHANTEDDSTKLVDGESIPPPPELSRNSRSSALIQINPAEPEAEVAEEPEGDATPTRDEHSDEAQPHWHDKLVQESDYDPAHPTEEAEEQDSRSSSTPDINSSSADTSTELGPVPPDHPPPPDERRPTPPPGPSIIEPSSKLPHSQEAFMPGGPRPQLPLISPFQRQPLPQQQTPQQPPPLLPFPGGAVGGPGQAQRFPPWPLANGPNSSMLSQGSGPPSGFPPVQQGFLPTPDPRPFFPVENSRLPLQLGASLPRLSHPLPQRELLPQQANTVRPPIPLSAMAPLAQLTSLLPALERAKMAAHREDHGISQSPQILKHSLPAVTTQATVIGKSPLVSSSATNVSSGPVRSSRGDQSGSTEVVDMDMSPGEDDCELELPSPNSSDSERVDKRRKGRKSDSRVTRTTLYDSSKTASGTEKGLIQPAMYLKALSKAIEKLTPKAQVTTAGGATASQDKTKSHVGRKKKLEVNDDDVPASAVDLTNKEKFLKKLHLQERVIDEVKLAIKPFYSSKKITKEQYKMILRKAVPKVCHCKSGNINPQKIQQLVEAYVGKLKKGKGPGGGLKKKKQHAAKDALASKEAATTSVKQNGEWAKKPTR